MLSREKLQQSMLALSLLLGVLWVSAAPVYSLGGMHPGIRSEAVFQPGHPTRKTASYKRFSLRYECPVLLVARMEWTALIHFNCSISIAQRQNRILFRDIFFSINKKRQLLLPVSERGEIPLS